MKINSVLIIEDNDDIRESTCEILELSNYKVFQAANGRAGVEMAIEKLPSLILCDVMMPDLDGFGVLYLLRRSPVTSTIPFIFVTAKESREDVRKGMDMGADDYLTKPFTEMELLHAVESRLQKKEREWNFFSASLEQIGKLAADNNQPAALMNMIEGRKIRHFKKKQVIYYDGDTPAGIFLVLSGRIKTFKLNEQGRELLMEFYEPDDYFGVHPLLLDESYREAAEAQDDCSVCLLPRAEIEQVLLHHPVIARQFLRLIANNLKHKEDQLIQLAYHSVRKRLAETLVRLAKRESGTCILHISRDDLAALTGIATETVSRTLSDFKDEGLIGRERNQISVLDVSRLIRMKN